MKKYKVILASLLLALPLTIQPMAQNPCSICFESLSLRRLPLQTLPCHPGHTFHQTCIHPWLTRIPHCPLCRAKHHNPLKFGCLGCMVSLGCTVKSYTERCTAIVIDVLTKIEEDLARANDERAGV